MRVEVEHLSRRFGSAYALRDVSFEIRPGRRVALVGPNGSGKSTVNRILMGLLRYEGSVRLGGRAPHEDRLEVARCIAYVPQIAPRLGAPVREVVRSLSAIRGDTPARIGKQAARLELDLEAVAKRPFRDLSGGMKQKLLIALALATDASLLILDEPTGSLDPRGREHFFGLLEDLSPEITVLLCSHRIEEVRQIVDHVLVLADGRLVYDGGAAAFLDTASHCVIEVCTADARASDWLQARGFRRGVEGWWVCTTARGEKLPLLTAVTRELGSSLRDLNVRDFESLHVDTEPDA